MFLGIYSVKLREKNRVAFPSKFRKITGDQLLLTNWFENSIMILPKDKWESHIESLFDEKMVLLPEMRDLDRFLFGGTFEVNLDPEGRFVLPSYLKEYARIGKEIVFTGGMWSIQAWDKKVFESQRAINAVQIKDKAIKIFQKKEMERT